MNSHNNANGTLYLLPVTLGDDNVEAVLPAPVIQTARNINTFVVENEKSARRFLSLIKTTRPVRELTLMTLNEHTPAQSLPSLLQPLLAGNNVAIISEAGCPGIADPGALLVDLAHHKGIRVVPLVGPSSILLALMASGFNGQRFTFLGYLPSEKSARVHKLKEIETESRRHQETQVFIETPYRNQHLFEDLLAHCHPNTHLCVAINVSLASERIIRKCIAEWRNSPVPELQKQPAVFLLLA